MSFLLTLWMNVKVCIPANSTLHATNLVLYLNYSWRSGVYVEGYFEF